MKTSALPPGRRLNGRKPPQANPSESARTSTRSFGCTVDGVDREVGAGDRCKGRREAVHVVEEVEGVRDPHEPDERHHRRDDVVREQLHAQAARDRDAGGPELRRELRQRAEMPEVVE